MSPFLAMRGLSVCRAISLLWGVRVHGPTTLSHLLQAVEDASDLTREYYPQLYEADQQRIAEELWELRARTEWVARKRVWEIAVAEWPALAVHFHAAKRRAQARREEDCAEAAGGGNTEGSDPA